MIYNFFFQAKDGIRDRNVTGVQTCALPISSFYYCLKRGVIMAAHCQVTGAGPGTGYKVSHSNCRTKRRFNPNIQKKSYFAPSLGRKVTLNVSASGINVIDARGIDSVISELIAKGVKL